MPVERAGRTIMRVLLHSAVREAQNVLRGDDVRATHDMRVALRRLRTAMQTFGPSFPRRRFGAYERAARRVARRLGAVRDADVHLAVLRAQLAGAAPGEAPGIAYAIDTLIARRRRALARFGIEYSQFDRDGLAGMLADG